MGELQKAAFIKQEACARGMRLDFVGRDRRLQGLSTVHQVLSMVA